jgi:pyruvate/2-oxoglutarate dehydrogenase complex dihydrolipoamide acyltransferase (E2) component
MARKLAKNVYVGETLYMAGSTPPKEDAEQITNPAAWGDESSDDDAGEGSKSYADQTVDELAEAAAERGIDVEGTGKDGKVLKKDLVSALETDDADNAS